MPPTPTLPEDLDALARRAHSADGQPPFSDQSLVEFARGERTLLQSPPQGAPSAAALVGPAPDGPEEFELVVDPDARKAGLGTALLQRVLAAHPDAEYAWAHGDHPAARALAARFGFTPVRTLLQLRAPVVMAESAATPGASDPPVAAFRPGVDDADWLALNARAFADHPEQGGLTQRDLDDRKAEPWFEADDFLLLRDGESLIGFCWLKIAHAHQEEPIGEFYAVGIDPDRQGEGLGRTLMEAGFARLAERGIRTANLYVEADNEPALALYRRHGFAQYTIDVRYRRGVRAAPGGGGGPGG